MDTKYLTEWITIRLDTAVLSGTQSAAEWLDLHDYEDVTLTLEVAALSGAITMNLETAATRQDSAFVPLVGAFAMATGVRVDAAPASLASFPLARFLRWRLTWPGGGAGAADVTFRIVAACHAPGA